MQRSISHDEPPKAVLIFLTGITNANTLVCGNVAAEAIVFDPDGGGGDGTLAIQLAGFSVGSIMIMKKKLNLE